MITTTQIQQELIPKLADISVMNQLVDVIYVDSNPATVEHSEIQKTGNLIKEIKKSQQYKLKKHRLILKATPEHSVVISDEVNAETIKKDTPLCECFSLRINRGFMDVIDNLSKIEKSNWSYFDRNFFSQIFFKRTKNDLIHKLLEYGKDSSYVIVSDSVAKIIQASNFFESNNNKSDSMIKNLGNLKIDNVNLNVYLYSEMKENKVYFGRYDSVSIILNKNLNVTDLKSTSQKTNIMVEVEYEFIQKEAIKCLYL